MERLLIAIAETYDVLVTVPENDNRVRPPLGCRDYKMLIERVG